MYNVKKLVKDSILVALICVYLLIVISTGLVLYSTVTVFAASIFIAFYFKDKKIARCGVACIAVLVISLLYFDLVTKVIPFILPSIVLGFVSSLLLRMENKKLMYAILFVVYYAVEIGAVLLEAKFFMNVNLLDYIVDDSFNEVASYINNNVTIFVIMYFVVLLAISVMKVLILNMGNKIYDQRFKKFIDRYEE